MNKKKIFLTSLIVILILGIFVYFSIPYYKAYKEGVSVKYFKDSKYCEQDSDCVTQKGCPINRYNQDKGTITFELLCSTCGIKCINNTCIGLECNEQ